MADAYEKYKITNINEAMKFSASRDTFEIKEVELINENETSDGYLIALRGTDSSWDKEDVLSLPVCFKSGIAKDSIYSNQVKTAIFNTIPEGSKIVFIGHSLGGMVAQIVAADISVKSKYDIVNVLTIGSPYVLSKGNKCPLNRVFERFDAIPGFGLCFIGGYFLGKPKVENHGYIFKPVLAHTDAYRFGEKWEKYDAFGILNGTNIINLK